MLDINIFWFPPLIMAIIFGVMFLVSLILFAKAAYRLYLLLKMCKPDPEPRFDKIPQRIKELIVNVLFHKKVFKYPLAGIMHFLIFSGFLVLFTVIVEAVLEGFGIFHLPLIGELLEKIMTYPLLKLLQDIFTGLVLLGLGIAAFIRFVLKPKRFEGSSKLEAGFILMLIFLIMLGMLSMNASKILFLEKIGEHDEARIMANSLPLSFLFSKIYQPLSSNALGHIYNISWWGHIIVIFFFLVYLPRSKHLHLLAAVPNIFTRSFRPNSEIREIKDIENQETFGVSKIEEFTWKQMLDTYACTECGRCQDQCPAYNTEKPLSPKILIHDLKVHLFEKGDAILQKKEQSDILNKKLIGDVIKEDVIWSCTTCRGCENICPVFIERIDKIVDMRRNMVLMESNFPQEVNTVFRNLEKNGNPWGIGAHLRGDWAKDIGVKTLAEAPDVEYCYYVGCAGAFDDRNKKIAIAFSKILQNAGVSFGILGVEETCCGDSARRIGNEYLYQILAQQNIETLKRYNVKKIITTCPHGYNIIKNEYPQFGGNFEVYHHTEIIYNLIKEGKLKVKNVDKKITYHDSCYLGRYNDIYKQPREILKDAGYKVVEMRDSGERSFCCGAGGGRMWMEEHIGKRINFERCEQAIATGADIIAVACPFCLTMFDEGIKHKNKEEEIKIFDIVEAIEILT